MYFESGKMDKNAMFQESFKNGFGYMSVNFQNMDNRERISWRFAVLLNLDSSISFSEQVNKESSDSPTIQLFILVLNAIAGNVSQKLL